MGPCWPCCCSIVDSVVLAVRALLVVMYDRRSDDEPAEADKDTDWVAKRVYVAIWIRQ
jgi:hypothetical protein